MNKTDHGGSDPSQVCYYLHQINSRGLPFGENPLGYSVPSFLLQFSLISMVTRLVHFLLKPVGQPLIVAQILGGVLLGPSVLGRNMSFLAKVFPRKSRLVLDTVSIFGFMLFVFLIGVKMDLSMVVRSGKKALAVGILGFFIPLGLAGLVAFLLNKFLSLDHDVARALPHVVPMLSMTAFPVITCFLDELKILNSEIGRLASSSSVICDVCLWSITCINFVAELAKTNSLEVIIGSSVSAGLFIIIVIVVIRPAALWVIQHTPETRPVKETYIVLALVILMASGFAGEIIGIQATTASLILGLIIPDGPPLGAALVETLDCFVSLMLLPLFFTVAGLKVDVFCIQNLKNVGVLQLVVLVAFIGKIMGSMLPLIICRMPFRDALSLGLIMNSKGIVELAFLSDIKNQEVVTEEVYAIMIVSVVAITGVISPIVKFLYDPSKRFIAYKRRTILHCRNNDELRILACIHQEENVHSIISLLQVSNITKDSPINLVVLHLVKLMGRASSLLVPHRQCDKPPRNPTQSERIFNAFKKFEQQNPEFFMVHCYKGIAPYMTMHNDVCSLALEKRTILIILPFHKQWTSGETIESSHAYRHLNKSVLEKAPCSVGILIDHRSFKSPYVITEHSAFRVVVLFFGGADDREALAYAQRMSDHNSVRLTVLRFVTSGPAEIVAGTERSKLLDADILSNFKLRTQHTEEIAYKEKVVTSGMDVIMVARSVANAYNLVMVGRRHGDSPIMLQLAKWNERGDLGAIGEILAASELKGEASVLVVQQQTRLWGLRDPEESTHLRRIKL
ncbi:hypothetical protein Pfo_018357 [Paulownia fortunei]|nr:hypothetical protein Pfo_018357 [Paulownia fortunei]